MDPIVYHIPVSMVKEYSGRNLIVRSHDPSAIVGALSMEDQPRVSYVQVLSLRSNLKPLTHWGHSIPVDLVIEDPDIDLPLLYDCSSLCNTHPVRVTVPVVPRFTKVVKLAVALNFAVKMEVSQPGPHLCQELTQVAHSYLHQTTVAQPIEYFHSVFVAFYGGKPANLWAIQEEDPSLIRYITDEGEESLSKRFAGYQSGEEVPSFLTNFRATLTTEEAECCSCEFLSTCSGYFKWPQRDYRCDGVKTLFRMLRDAAKELREDLAAFQSMRGGGHP